jgi:hypothetical protein
VKVTAAPMVVGEHVVLPMHKDRDCEGSDEYGELALGYHLGDQRMHTLIDDVDTEGTPMWVAEEGVVLWPALEPGGLRILDDESFTTLAKVTDQSASVDTSPTWLGDSAYFGTINQPNPLCQGEPDPDCGAVFRVGLDGSVEGRLDVEDGLRMWVTGSPTSDGEVLYLGGGEQTLGDSEETYLMGCSMIKVSSDLELLGYGGPGVVACYPNGPLESAVAGEAALGPDSVWVQFRSPGDERHMVAVIRYDRDLVEQCRAEFAASHTWGAASFYQAPTVDAENNAYVTMTLPKAPMGASGYLLKIAPDCSTSTLHTSSYQLRTTPTLADDNWVLLAAGDELLVISTDGEIVETHELASDSNVSGGPVIVDGKIYVLAADGSLTIIEDTAVTGYGKAWWPRFRHDNSGSGAL